MVVAKSGLETIITGTDDAMTLFLESQLMLHFTKKKDRACTSSYMTAAMTAISG
jgi:hypothetical protein